LANETALNVIGAKEEEVLGKYFWDTPWWSHSRKLQEKLKKAILRAAAGQFVRFEATHPDIHGELRLHDTSLNPLLDDNGNVTHIIPEARDITDIKRTESALHQALAELEQLKNRLEDENVYLQEEIRLEHNFGDIIGRSNVLKKVLGQVEQVASTDATVLILGETGTGKELIVRAVHELSHRKSRPLVKVNCAALPANLIESELFGHEKGAFTGAQARKIGRFELADRGTIFLDEIGDLPLELQAKLLRILQEGEFERLGNPKTITVDVRVLAATNRDLGKIIQKGDFREDLFYRLNVYPVTCPPLRDRREDVPILVKHFVDRYSLKIGKKIDTIPKKVMKALQSYHWPGNVRELENIIERALVISRGNKLDIGDWLSRDEMDVHKSKIPTLTELESDHILKVLDLTSWRVSGSGGAAEKLGLKPTTLEARMKKLGIRRA
jgi:PAS domain S-box-containing protein